VFSNITAKQASFIYVANVPTLTITECTFTNGVATFGYGGAVCWVIVYYLVCYVCWFVGLLFIILSVMCVGLLGYCLLSCLLCVLVCYVLVCWVSFIILSVMCVGLLCESGEAFVYYFVMLSVVCVGLLAMEDNKGFVYKKML
jgi:hypothetical protein